MPTVTKTAIINTRVLHALSLASSNEETRYYLKGVCVVIEPHKVTYVATDDHVLAAYQEPADQPNTLCGTYIIPADTCKSVKPKGRSLPYMVLSFVGGKKYMLDGRSEEH